MSCRWCAESILTENESKRSRSWNLVTKKKIHTPSFPQPKTLLTNETLVCLPFEEPFKDDWVENGTIRIFLPNSPGWISIIWRKSTWNGDFKVWEIITFYQFQNHKSRLSVVGCAVSCSGIDYLCHDICYYTSYYKVCYQKSRNNGCCLILIGPDRKLGTNIEDMNPTTFSIIMGTHEFFNSNWLDLC